MVRTKRKKYNTHRNKTKGKSKTYIRSRIRSRIRHHNKSALNKRFFSFPSLKKSISIDSLNIDLKSD